MASPGTEDGAYAARLERLRSIWWKRLFDVQRPYRRHLCSLRLGLVLDVGCGTGRNLENLKDCGGAVGVDHNPHSVAIARRRGFEAYVPDAFRASPHAVPGRFDSLLLAHVAEHMTVDEGVTLLREYLTYVRHGGRAVLVTPQEAGFRSDPTHVVFLGLTSLDRLARAAGLEPRAAYSFPLPRLFGRVFRYNEFVLVADKP